MKQTTPHQKHSPSPTFLEDRALAPFLHLFFPSLCYLCERRKPMRGHRLCARCLALLPRTNFHLWPDNPFAERFWGRIPLYAGAACFFFRKGGLARKLVHKLKYEGHKELGIWAGREYGQELREAPVFSEVDCILPVPLHRKKLLQRGFNQSVCFAKGLAESMGIPWYSGVLVRESYTDTQTRKSQMERLRNVGDAFAVRHTKTLKNRHVLLVDDVLTTGATLEACALTLLKVPGVKISMATIALAT